MKKLVFEILVSKANESGPEAFSLVLGALHKSYDFGNRHILQTFSFEIVKIAQNIRFFIVVPEKYAEFFKNQIFAHYNGVEMYEVQDYLGSIPSDKIQINSLHQSKHFLYPIQTYEDILSSKDGAIDPLSSITSSLLQASSYTVTGVQIVFHPVQDRTWKKGFEEIVKVLNLDVPPYMKKILLSKYFKYLKYGTYPFYYLGKFLGFIISYQSGNNQEHGEGEGHKNQEKGEGEGEEKESKFVKKISLPGYEVGINLFFAGEKEVEGRGVLRDIASTFSTFSLFGGNTLISQKIDRDILTVKKLKERKILVPNTFNTIELATLAHLPTSYVKTPSIQWLQSRAFEPPTNLPLISSSKQDEITPLGKTTFRGKGEGFGILADDRRRHMYIIGKTGMGKSTLLENMIIDDMKKGRGLAVIDPHGDLAEAVIGHIPKNRTNHAIIFDPSDKEWPIAFNMLEDVDPEQRPLIASGLVGIFKKIFGESWGPRLEHTLLNTILALLEYPNTTLISIPLMLTSDVYRNRVVLKITDPVVRKFWKTEFGKLNPSQKTETVNPILNKVGQFLSSPLLRNILGQNKNSFSLRWAMDNGKIIIVNLSKGKIGEDASSLLGAMMITKFQLDAMSRANIPEKERKDFYLYVDEFQNFATDSFTTILSEARKYKLNLVMANQYINQMEETVRGAVFGNVGSLLSFQVGIEDAKILKEAFGSGIVEDDLMNLKKYNLYMKELIDGMPSPIFSAHTYAPEKKDEEEFKLRYNKILQVSREKYCKPRDTVVKKMQAMMKEIEDAEDDWEDTKKERKEKK